MGAVHLGKIHLRWCRRCGLPVLEEPSCGICGGPTKPVKITPPGDARPAFIADIALVRETADREFGPGCGKALLPDGMLVLLNKCPSADRMDEVILGGQVVCALVFEPGIGHKLLLKPEGAQRIKETADRNWVVVDRGAIGPIRAGSNAMAPGILGAWTGLQAGAETLVFTYARDGDEDAEYDEGRDMELLAVGTAKKSYRDLQDPNRLGVGVKIRSVVSTGKVRILPYAPECPGLLQESLGREQSWADAVKANSAVLHRREQQAVQFIGALQKDYPGREIAVSFSGGKDSLATLLIAFKAGLRPKVIFIDTGLEFPETVAHVSDVAKKHGLEVVSESAGGDFWKYVDVFGPPGKDFRWCCKICKLGPTSRAIAKAFPGGVVSLIGQRKYESEQRSSKGPVWKNAWVSGQIGASPIQSWTALHVWLYIFSKGEGYNPWYERGLERIGCYLCPASDLAEIEKVGREFPGYARWREYLQKHYAGKGSRWVELGLWRWKILPEGMKQIAGDAALPAKEEVPGQPAQPRPPGGINPISLKMADGYQPCETGYSAEGVFSRPVDLARAANLLAVLGPVEVDKDGAYCKAGTVTVFREGVVVVKGRTKEEVRALARKVYELACRWENCVGCRVCQARCRHGALLVGERVEIDAAKCRHCGECLGPCAVVDYGTPWDFWVGGDGGGAQAAGADEGGGNAENAERTKSGSAGGAKTGNAEDAKGEKSDGKK